jgi:hypothetical protein
VAPDDVAPDDVAPDDVAPDDVAPDDVAPDDVAPDDVAPDDVAGMRSPAAGGVHARSASYSATPTSARRPSRAKRPHTGSSACARRCRRAPPCVRGRASSCADATSAASAWWGRACIRLTSSISVALLASACAGDVSCPVAGRFTSSLDLASDVGPESRVESFGKVELRASGFFPCHSAQSSVVVVARPRRARDFSFFKKNIYGRTWWVGLHADGRSRLRCPPVGGGRWSSTGPAKVRAKVM